MHMDKTRLAKYGNKVTFGQAGAYNHGLRSSNKQDYTSAVVVVVVGIILFVAVVAGIVYYG
jgi:hypothetical protein